MSAPITYGSVCSGIEAASVAWHPLGWRSAFFSEIEPFPRAVLAEHWSDVTLHGDFTKIESGQYDAIDVLVGGTPCQDFSVAGLRAGLTGERGGLTIEFAHLAKRLRSRWLVWENVPGVLSIDDGQAFGAFLGLLAECGYGFAYRILDAQYFGIPQRRRRVFVIGYLGDWRPAAAVLFERESLRWDSPPRREARQDVAGTIGASLERGSADEGERGNLIAGGHTNSHANAGVPTAIAFGGNRQSGALDVATAVNAHGGPHGRLDFESETFVTHSLRADGFDASEDGTGRGTLVCGTLRANSGRNQIEQTYIPKAVALRGREGGATAELSNVPGTLRASGSGGDKAHALTNTVRRITPRECERLQGFPNNYTAITYRGKPAADGPRYKALGNSMAVPVMRWIGERIATIETLLQ